MKAISYMFFLIHSTSFRENSDVIRGFCSSFKLSESIFALLASEWSWFYFLYSQTSHLSPNSFGILFKRIRGVCPMWSKTLGRMLAGLGLPWMEERTSMRGENPLEVLQMLSWSLCASHKRQRGSYRSGWLWGDSETGAPGLQVHLLGKSGRIHFNPAFLCSPVPFSPASPCGLRLSSSRPLWSVPAALPLPEQVSPWVRSAAGGQADWPSSKQEVADTDGMTNLQKDQTKTLEFHNKLPNFSDKKQEKLFDSIY